jgi:HAD superfamily phosphoserine phosphatase-like hydrolase
VKIKNRCHFPSFSSRRKRGSESFYQSNVLTSSLSPLSIWLDPVFLIQIESELATYFLSVDSSISINSLSLVRSASIHLSLSSNSEIPKSTSPCLESNIYSKALVHSHVATVYSDNGLSPSFYAALFTLFSRYNVEIINLRRLCTSGLSIQRAFDMKIAIPESSLVELRSELFTLSSTFKADVNLQPSSIHRKNKRLVIFDMDSTLIRQECIDEIAREANILKSVADITERAMNGELDFTESLHARVALLKGVGVDVLEVVKGRIEFTEGAREVTRILKILGVKMGVVSGKFFRWLIIKGGFMPLANWVKEQLNLDYAFANNVRPYTVSY